MKGIPKPKILHIAPFNIAGVPITLVKAEREAGHYSRLITLGKHPHRYEEDICLRLPLLTFPGLKTIKKIVANNKKLEVSNLTAKRDAIPLVWQAKGIEKFLFHLREMFWKPLINRAIQKYNIDHFDVIQLDGGLEFYRDGRVVRMLKQQGKKIICCYLGSDLRLRGVIPEIDAQSDLNLTDEFDHLQLHPDIHHIFFPFDWSKFAPRPFSTNAIIKIGHAPTNRQAKGSDIIIPIVQKLAQEFPVELILIEKLPYAEAIRRKAQCDIFIDQIGELGYGINSLEALAMEIPTCSCLAPGFEQQYPDHPFIVIDEHNLRQCLIELIHDKKLRREKGVTGRQWIQKYHDVRTIVQRIHRLAGIANEVSA